MSESGTGLRAGTSAWRVSEDNRTILEHLEIRFRTAARYRLPVVYPFRFFAVDGGLASYGPDQVEQYRRAAGERAKAVIARSISPASRTPREQPPRRREP
jgi:hypothetical protein